MDIDDALQRKYHERHVENGKKQQETDGLNGSSGEHCFFIFVVNPKPRESCCPVRGCFLGGCFFAFLLFCLCLDVSRKSPKGCIYLGGGVPILGGGYLLSRQETISWGSIEFPCLHEYLSKYGKITAINPV